MGLIDHAHRSDSRPSKTRLCARDLPFDVHRDSLPRAQKSWLMLPKTGCHFARGHWKEDSRADSGLRLKTGFGGFCVEKNSNQKKAANLPLLGFTHAGQFAGSTKTPGVLGLGEKQITSLNFRGSQSIRFRGNSPFKKPRFSPPKKPPLSLGLVLGPPTAKNKKTPLWHRIFCFSFQKKGKNSPSLP